MVIVVVGVMAVMIIVMMVVVTMAGIILCDGVLMPVGFTDGGEWWH